MDRIKTDFIGRLVRQLSLRNARVPYVRSAFSLKLPAIRLSKIGFGKLCPYGSTRCVFPADRNTISGFFNNVLPVRQHLPATRLSKIGFGELCPYGSTRCAFPADRNTISVFFNNVLPVRQHFPATRLSKNRFWKILPVRQYLKRMTYAR